MTAAHRPPPPPRGGVERYRRRVEAVAREIAGEHLLVPLRGECADLQRVFALTSVAGRVWEELGGGERTLAELRDAVVAGFEVEPATAERDLRDFLADLEREGLVERRSEDR